MSLRDADRAGVGERAEIQPGQAIMSVSMPMLGVASFSARKLAATGRTARCCAHVREHQVLVVGDAHSGRSCTASARSRDAPPSGRRSCRPGDRAVRLERHEHRAIAGHLVRARVVAVPGAKRGLARRRSRRCRRASRRAAAGRSARTRSTSLRRQLRRACARRPATRPRPARGSASMPSAFTRILMRALWMLSRRPWRL